MHVDFWANVGIICAAILSLGGVIAGGVHFMRALWRRARREEDLREMLMGDPNHKPPIPSISERLEAALAEQRANNAALVSQIAHLQVTLDEHIQWHASPGGRPAKPTVPRPNGPAPGRR